MSSEQQSAKATLETARANQAEWRARAIRATSRGFVHLMQAYEGNPALLEEIGAMQSQFENMFQWRIVELEKIAQVSRDTAQRATALLVGE